MTDEASLRHWLSENCLHVWSLLKNQARKQLPPGVLEYLSPLSEEQLDILAEEIPELHRGYLLAEPHRQRYAQQRAEEGRLQLMSADEHVKRLIEVCGLLVPGGRDELQPIDLYCKLRDVPEQFPEGMVNLVFVFHRSFNDRETLEQALFGWAEACLRPVSLKPGPQEEDGLFAREEWLDISGCCLCRVEGDMLRVLELWENPRAYISIPPPVRSALLLGSITPKVPSDSFP